MAMNGKISIPENSMIPKADRKASTKPGLAAQLMKGAAKSPARPPAAMPSEPDMGKLMELYNSFKQQAPNRGGVSLSEQFLNPGPPIPKQPMNMAPGFAAEPERMQNVPPELLRLVMEQLSSKTPQIPRSNSIASLLGRK